MKPIRHLIRSRLHPIALTYLCAVMMAVLLAGGQPVAQAFAPDAPTSIVTQSGDIFWQTECVDCPKQFSLMSNRSLALDSGGHPHIAYGEDHLYYAWHDGASWHVETVDSTAGVGEYATLALDKSGRPHIAYSGRTNPGIKYAHKDGSGWKITTVDADPTAREFPSLVLDSQDRPHISYDREHPSYSTWGYLMYARWDGIQWIIAYVDDLASPSSGGPKSLVLDSAERPHIAYYTFAGSIKYAVQDDEGWNAETVDQVTITSGDGAKDLRIALALDGDGTPHVSYSEKYGGYGAHIRYARRSGHTWQIQIVDSGGSRVYVSMALDVAGQPHLAYYGATGFTYTHWTGAAWESRLIGATDQRAEYIALALQDDGRPHIGFLDPANRTLKHGQLKDDTWQIDVIDSMRAIGDIVLLALDGLDRPHIAYTDFPGFRRRVRYAYKDASAWATSIVDGDPSGRDVGALAIDGDNHPHIGYRNTYNSNLLYGYWDGQTWQRQKVADRASELALTTDAQGNLHFAYMAGVRGLVYSTWDGSKWTTETVTTSQVYAISLLFAGDDSTPCLAYSQEYERLLLACRAGGLWTVRSLQRSYSLDYQRSAPIVGNDGSIYLAYYDDRSIKYARWIDNRWQTETAAMLSQSAVRADNIKLALDTSGRAHIMFLEHADYPYRPVRRYVTGSGGVWNMQAISVNTADIALTVDSAGRPHISYFDPINGDLKYAVGLPLASRTYLPVVIR